MADLEEQVQELKLKFMYGLGLITALLYTFFVMNLAQLIFTRRVAAMYLHNQLFIYMILHNILPILTDVDWRHSLINPGK